MNCNFNSQYPSINYLSAFKGYEASFENGANKNYFKAFSGLEAPFENGIGKLLSSNNGGNCLQDLMQATPECMLERDKILAEQRKKILAESEASSRVQYLSCEFGDCLNSNDIESMRKEVKQQVDTVIERAKKTFH